MFQAIVCVHALAKRHAEPATVRAIEQVEMGFILGSRAAAATLRDLISHPEGARIREIAMDLHELADMAHFFASEAYAIGERIP